MKATSPIAFPDDLSVALSGATAPVCAAQFLGSQESWPLVDVRTPAEFAHAHIPGARSLPLFSNDERAQVGLSYRQNGRAAAIALGLRIVEQRLQQMVSEAQAVLGDSIGARVYCWRGGMRSASMCWFLEHLGYRTSRLDGGYKTFRRHVADLVSLPRRLLLIGGLTGTGKTDALHALAAAGEQVIDLEGLANHRGSAFGAVGLGSQPTHEQFENRLALAWQATDPDRVLWLEDEGRRIGRVSIPNPIVEQMHSASVLVLDLPLAERIRRLRADYGDADLAELISCVERVQKRLGGVRTQAAIEALRRGDYAEVVENLLVYYDKAYRHAMDKRTSNRFVAVSVDDGDVASALLAAARATEPPPS